MSSLERTSLPAGHSLLLRGGGGAPPPAPPFPLAPSGLAERLRTFLPALSAANEQLHAQIAAEGQSSVDIEALEREDAAHIQMDLALAELNEDEESEEGEDSEESEESERGGSGILRMPGRVSGLTRKAGAKIKELDADGKEVEREAEEGSEEEQELPGGEWIINPKQLSRIQQQVLESLRQAPATEDEAHSN
jgi:Domain of unknown function (DUF4598)